MEYTELTYACALSAIFTYNCEKAKLLLEHYSSAEEIFSLSREELSMIFGNNSYYIENILNPNTLKKAQADLEWSYRNNVKIVYIKDSTYPYRLKECIDAPIIMYYVGNADLNHKRIISIVGTRKSTPYGRDMCNAIVDSFASLKTPPIIVSGLAYGIDICAHKRAIYKGIETVGVMGTGIDSIYPRENRETAALMTKQGGILTDIPKGSAPLGVNFIRRNRIIAGLSDAVILVESKIKGGGMITSKMASSYSREVFCLPGRITDPISEGCNYLINNNIASIITTPESIATALGWNDDKVEKVEKKIIFEDDSPIKRKILLALSSYSSYDYDSLLEATGSNIQDLTLNLTELELDGRIHSHGNGKFSII